MSLINLLIWLIILGLVFYVIYWAVNQIPLPAPFNVVVRVVLALIVVIVLLSALFGGFNVPHLIR